MTVRVAHTVATLAATVLLATMAGCASIQPVVTPTAAADLSAGYVAGTFSRNQTRGFAFVLKSADGREYTMSLGEDTFTRGTVVDQTVAIKVPPGSYTVTRWMTYALLTKEVMSRSDVKHPVLGKPFVIKPGGVAHLGSFEVTESMSMAGVYGTVNLAVKPKLTMQRDVQATFANAYPLLKAQPLSCILCLDTALMQLLQQPSAQATTPPSPPSSSPAAKPTASPPPTTTVQSR